MARNFDGRRIGASSRTAASFRRPAARASAWRAASRAAAPPARSVTMSGGRPGAAAARSTISSPVTTPIRVAPSWVKVASFIRDSSVLRRAATARRRAAWSRGGFGNRDRGKRSVRNLARLPRRETEQLQHDGGGAVRGGGVAEALDRLLHPRSGDRLLGGEVIVEGAEPDVGRVGDLLDRRGADTLAGHELAGRPHEPRPGLQPAAGAAIRPCGLGPP